MSRITPPITKFTHAVRSISSSPKAARPSTLLNSQSANFPRKHADLKAACSERQLKTSGSKAELVERLAAHDVVRSHTTSAHRPSPSQKERITPLMQTFHTTSRKNSSHDSSTIDFFFFPEVPEAPPVNPFAKLRVPLLPDNYTPDRSPNSAHAVEALDQALPRAEISIIASHPENVGPAAMSEVVGNNGLEVDIGQLTADFSSTPFQDLNEPGLLKELWSGLVDDIFGGKGGGPKAAL